MSEIKVTPQVISAVMKHFRSRGRPENMARPVKVCRKGAYASNAVQARKRLALEKSAVAAK